MATCPRKCTISRKGVSAMRSKRTSKRTFALLLALAVCAAAEAGEARTYGKPLRGLKPTPLADVLASPDDGRIASSCPIVPRHVTAHEEKRRLAQAAVSLIRLEPGREPRRTNWPEPAKSYNSQSILIPTEN